MLLHSSAEMALDFSRHELLHRRLGSGGSLPSPLARNLFASFLFHFSLSFSLLTVCSKMKDTPSTSDFGSTSLALFFSHEC